MCARDDAPNRDPPHNGEDGPLEDRRRFLSRLSLGLGAVAGAMAAAPWLAVFLNPVQRRDPEAWTVIGRLEDFPPGEIVQVAYLDADPLPWAGFSGRNAAWIRREEGDELTAFSAYCTHIGCPVRWDSGARLFLCPCHGGAFYDDGSVAAGPPPRPLDRFPIRVRDGQVELRPEGVPPPDG